MVGALSSGCETVNVVRPLAPPEDVPGEVLVYRESSILAMAEAMPFGVNGETYAILQTSQYARFHLANGPYTFFVQGATGDRYIAKIDVGFDLLCIRAFPNPTNVLKSLSPTGFLIGQTFLLESAPCPPLSVLSKLQEVAVEYRAK